MQVLSIPLALLLFHIVFKVNAEICTADVCRYDFEIRYAQTMTYRPPGRAAYDVQLNSTGNGYVIVENDGYRRLPDRLIGTSVGLDEVIAADGYQRTIITINGEFPGPTIEVQAGAEVAIRIINKLHSDDVTIHWHGMLMRGTTWMDGVPDVSQCPIPSGHTFTYRFRADPEGTHWYHSHVTRQRLYGLDGLLIVHPRVPPSSLMPYHTLSIGDWFREDGHSHHILDTGSVDQMDSGTGGGLFASPGLRDILPDGAAASGLKWFSGLINGRGRYDPLIKTPLSVFRVNRGQRYRFRMANVGSDFALSVSVDRHLLTVVATDGYDIEPVTADYIIAHVGETVDFELDANQLGPRFWLRATTLRDSLNDGEVHEVRAIIHYEPFKGDCDPTSRPRPCTQAAPCLVYNCPTERYPASHNKTCYILNQVRTLVTQEHLNEEYGLDQNNVREIFLNMAVQDGANMNGIRYIKPSAPPFQRDSAVIDCDEVCTNPTSTCACHHRYQLEYMKPVRFIVSNFPRRDTDFHHPFHVHGHHFAVLHVGYPAIDQTTGHRSGLSPDIECESNPDGRISVCKQPHWNPSMVPLVFDTSRVALKTTLSVPSGGYAVVQIMADNPGFWLVHCHMAAHQANGMTVLLEEAPYNLKAPPPGFPTCYNYEPTEEEADQFFGELQTTGGVVEPNGDIQYILNECPNEVFPRQQNTGQQNPSRRQGQTQGDSNINRFNVLLGEIFNIFNRKK